MKSAARFRYTSLITVLFAGLFCSAAVSAADVTTPQLEGEFPGKNSLEASIFRGSIVYTNYCVLCHGVKGDGHGRAARLYDPKPANLVLSDKNPQYKELIVRRGGKALGRSQFMPPWGEELTDEQVTDVVTFLGSIVAKDK
jgi:mono/diheme cytochrome c family protein